MNLSAHFTLEELTHSDKAMRLGVDNTPPPAIVEKLKRTAAGMEQVRTAVGCPVFVTSGYRSPRVNALAGGAATSQHCKGEAVDFTAPAYGPPREICHAIVESNIDFDQLIFEGSWVHVSFVDGTPRRQVLTAHFPTREGEKVHYTPGDRMSEPTLGEVMTELRGLTQVVGEVKATLNFVQSSQVTQGERLTRIEVKQENAREAVDRAFLAIKDLGERVQKVELEQPLTKLVRDHVVKAVIGVLALLAPVLAVQVWSTIENGKRPVLVVDKEVVERWKSK